MDIRRDTPSVTALNFHVWQPCNMSCRYCFAGFNEAVPQLQADKALLRERAMDVVRAASDAGIGKLTFVGGEPMLCPWLGELLMLATMRGMVTMVVSNGSRMDMAWLAKHAPWLRWAGISIDSLSPQTNEAIGRVARNQAVPDALYYRGLLARLNAVGVRTKVNTVVSALNWQEDFTDFLRQARPERWKVLQALHIRGENDAAFPAMATTAEQFRAFVQRHRALQDDMTVAAEDNDAMTGSYLMVDPLGRFYSNVGGIQTYSQPIRDIGWHAARCQVEVHADKFIARGGLYDW